MRVQSSVKHLLILAMNISYKEELLLTISTIAHYYCYYPKYYSILFFDIESLERLFIGPSKTVYECTLRADLTTHVM